MKENYVHYIVFNLEQCIVCLLNKKQCIVCMYTHIFN